MAAVSVPNGRQQFIDPASSLLVALGTVEMYIPGTSTPKACWTDEEQTIPNAFPILLDAGGSCNIWGTGLYRQIVKRADGTIVWDQETGFINTGGGGGGGDVNGPGASIAGHAVIWASTDGTQIADGGVLGALAALSSVNNTNWSGAALTVANGGVGSIGVPSNGQLLIGNGTNFTLATLTAGSGLSITNTAGGITLTVTAAGVGTVTSIDVSGGSTGLTATGGPVTGAGTITLAGTLAIANGGTGQTTATAARAALLAEPLGEQVGINTQTGSYTLVLSDKGKAMQMNVASANTLTVPPNASVAFPIDSRIDGFQYGTGATTITAGVGVTINANGGNLKTNGQFAGFSLLKIGTNEWMAWGNLTT